MSISWNGSLSGLNREFPPRKIYRDPTFITEAPVQRDPTFVVEDPPFRDPTFEVIDPDTWDPHERAQREIERILKEQQSLRDQILDGLINPQELLREAARRGDKLPPGTEQILRDPSHPLHKVIARNLWQEYFGARPA